MSASVGRVDLDALRARWPLEALAERYGVRLRREGARLRGTCPFHEDHSPSLVVYPETRSFFCFGCEAWGDAVDWVVRMEGVDFRAACELLGGSPPPPRPIRPTPARPRDTFGDGLPGWALDALREAADVYHRALRLSPEAFAFVRARGIGSDAVRRAWLGYATGHDLRRVLAERGRSAAGARLGLLNDRGREVLRGRLVVPVVVDGHVVTMTGRDGAPGLERRYLDLPLPPHVLGADLVRGQRRPVLVEGVTDFLVAIGWGYPALSPMGSHAAPHVREEARRATAAAELVVLALDNDAAGAAATVLWRDVLGRRAAPLAWPTGVNDVGDLAQRPGGRDLFARLVAEAERRWRSGADQEVAV